LPICAIVLLVIPLLGGGGGGCVRRTLTVTTEPPGALVYLNGVEAGRSPIERDFVFYGTYDIAVRKEGYETLKTQGKVIAPWWQWVPFDFVAEFLPLHDRQTLTYTLYPISAGAVDPNKMLGRAEEFGTHLESSPYTRPPTPHAAATHAPTTRPDRAPTTTTTTTTTTTMTILRAAPTTVTAQPFPSNSTTRPSNP
jgi:hypothetical protein